MLAQAMILLLLTDTISASCPSSTSCGNLTIPFPFRISSDCSVDDSFLITCNHNFSPPKALLNSGTIEVVDISLDGQIKVASPVASDRYDHSGTKTNGTISELALSKFPISSARNKIVAVVGHDTYAPFQGSKRWKQKSGGCVSWCDSIDRLVNGSFSAFSLSLSSADLKNLQIRKLISAYKSLEDGSGCLPKSQINIMFYIASGLMVPAVVISWIFWRGKQKKVVKLRQNLFNRNGGNILQDMLSSEKPLSIFNAQDLKKATDNYDESKVIRREQHLGITYKGILPEGNRIVTIKQCHAFDQCNIFVLMSKLVSFSKINHRNVVGLMGCCLETQLPLVVYEFVTAKTLFDYLNDDSIASSLSWNIRLKIAAEASGAIAYMHSSAKVPFIHGNLSSSSILLHHGFTVKVQDFALTCSECSCVQFYVGSSGYLDPEYFSSGRLTEKSDVYSFGFVLAELLTGKNVMSPEWLQGEGNLAQYFVCSNRQGDLLEILDHRMVLDGKFGEITEVIEIAKRCLLPSSLDRPTMKQVALALEHVISTNARLSTPIQARRQVLLEM